MKKALGTVLATLVVFGLSGMASAADMPDAAKKCKTCHSFDKGGKNMVGPGLFGIAGAEAGKVEGFKYSEGFMKAYAGKKWDDATMDAWIADSKALIPTTKMVIKIDKPEDRKAIIGYINSLK